MLPPVKQATHRICNEANKMQAIKQASKRQVGCRGGSLHIYVNGNDQMGWCLSRRNKLFRMSVYISTYMSVYIYIYVDKRI